MANSMKGKSRLETGPPGRERRRLEAFPGYDRLKFSPEKQAETALARK
jgi:hypothetical protein